MATAYKAGMAVLAAVSALAAVDGQRHPVDSGAGVDVASAVRDFAETVEEATRFLAERHVKEFRRQELVRHAVRGLYAHLQEPVPEAVSSSLNRPIDGKEDAIAVLTDARRRLGRRKELLEQRDIDAALAGVFHQVEPQARLRPQREAREDPHGVDLAWSPRGIGVRLRPDPSAGYVRVVTPIKDGPAHRGGIMSGDLLIRLRNTGRWGDVADLDLRGRSVAEVERELAGRPRSAVTLTVVREGEPRPMHITVPRGRDEAYPETVFGRVRRFDSSWSFSLDAGRRIACLRVAEFGMNTEPDAKRALAELVEQGLNGLILDLRCNAGGYLDTAVNLADLFVADGLIVSVRGRSQHNRFEGEAAGGLPAFPVACLINRDTAGTAEVVAACLQDHRRAVLLGERTRGDAGVRSLLRLERGGSVAFTSAVFVRPNGRNLSRLLAVGGDARDWGVIPDREVRLSARAHAELTEHLQGLEIIPRPDMPPAVSSFRDLQVELAARELVRMIDKNGRSGTP